MNAISICEKLKIDNLGTLSEYINRRDLELNLIKDDFKIEGVSVRLNEITEIKNEIKILQGYFNSLIAKKEILTKEYNQIIARNLIKKLFGKLESTHRDIEFGDITIICKKNGFVVKDKYRNEFLEAKYRNTEIFNIIQC